jgi:hydroxymethylpyrimidine/phosphomethylpyrimidine kinase
MRTVLTIAGSDSSAGAGVQADLKTFAAHGVYGTTAITSLTAQGASGISSTFDLPAEVVRSQIEAVAADFRIAGMKTGMLARADVVLTIAHCIEQFAFHDVVVDPILAASDGRPLLSEDGISAQRDRLLPCATVATPNAEEAGLLANLPVRSVEDAREAASRIHRLGARLVVVKGGHLEGPDAVDVMFDGRAFHELRASRSPAPPPHGTGCAFASAIAANLALGESPEEAVRKAKDYVTGAIRHAWQPARGRPLLDHFWNCDNGVRPQFYDLRKSRG